VGGAGKLIPAKAPLHFGFELAGGVSADLVWVSAVESFVVTFHGVFVHALLEG